MTPPLDIPNRERPVNLRCAPVEGHLGHAPAAGYFIVIVIEEIASDQEEADFAKRVGPELTSQDGINRTNQEVGSDCECFYQSLRKRNTLRRVDAGQIKALLEDLSGHVAFEKLPEDVVDICDLHDRANTRDHLRGRRRPAIADLVRCISLASFKLLPQPSGRSPADAHL